MGEVNDSRRRFLQGGAAVAAAVGLSAVTGSSPASAAPGAGYVPAAASTGASRPNILVLLVDELRYPPFYEGAGAKAFRQEYLRTQVALRQTGLEFHRHYVAAIACAPSRASLFTGQYPSLHGVSSTNGVAKGAYDADMFWLDPDGVPTMGDYFRAGGYRTFYKGKWHGSAADLLVPGTRNAILSYDADGSLVPVQEQLYVDADRMGGYGFEGWVGPEPHGRSPLNTGSSPVPPAQGRDQGFATQSVELIDQLAAANCADPFLMVSSYVNPHDIAMWGYVTRATGQFDFAVEDIVPAFDELFDPAEFAQTLADDLGTKPSCQLDYRDTYNEWMQGVPPHDYWRLYYQLQKNSDDDMYRVYEALRSSPLYENTIVVFTSDHGDLLGSHGYMHQKWHNAYEESLHVPMIISNPQMFPTPVETHSLTSHIDVLPTLLGLAGLDAAALLPTAGFAHTDPVTLVGRDLSPLVRGEIPSVADPVYFMTDDEISRGLHQEGVFGRFYEPVIQPNHVETVVVELDGAIWKYSRYFDNPQFWSSPGTPGQQGVTDVTELPDEPLVGTPPAGVYTISCTRTIKYEPVPEEWELYNVTEDPMEVENLAGNPSYADVEAHLRAVLDQQRAAKRLYPASGPVPGQIGPSASRAFPLRGPQPLQCEPAPPTPPAPPTTPVPASQPAQAAQTEVVVPRFTG